MPAKKSDQRREAGQQTRDRLLAAAVDLLAQRGQEGVTLREITEDAGANVAAVSYHFGSLRALCDAAVEQALERYLDAQLLALSALGPSATLSELARAFSRPMVDALLGGGPGLAVMRTVARVGTEPPKGWDRLAGKFEQTRTDSLRVLRANLPEVGEAELVFRVRCAAGLLNWLALAPIGTELAGRSRKHVERLLTPVVAGALRGEPG
ncbi:AcrR family transcriptional regulator [Crossiella equi]|uniref:AcrR family transcriptional regulator n=1 Tax=Crossiella equi TaxID=130796 RepID=A0ABS5A4V4_9PSEU|nr:TetR family transcriptional regulator [Crossiella equi]MBP2471581.1 AcrR family transcriptional regulator [Crossiella equi]